MFGSNKSLLVPISDDSETILLRSENPSGMCAKLRTVAASNNRDHPTRSLCSRHIHMVLFFAHIPFVVNRAFNATPAERLQPYDTLHTWLHVDKFSSRIEFVEIFLI